MRITIADTTDAEHKEIELTIESNEPTLISVMVALDTMSALYLYGKLGEALRKQGALSEDEDEDDDDDEDENE